MISIVSLNELMRLCRNSGELQPIRLWIHQNFSLNLQLCSRRNLIQLLFPHDGIAALFVSDLHVWKKSGSRMKSSAQFVEIALFVEISHHTNVDNECMQPKPLKNPISSLSVIFVECSRLSSPLTHTHTSHPTNLIIFVIFIAQH